MHDSLDNSAPVDQKSRQVVEGSTDNYQPSLPQASPQQPVGIEQEKDRRTNADGDTRSHGIRTLGVQDSRRNLATHSIQHTPCSY